MDGQNHDLPHLRTQIWNCFYEHVKLPNCMWLVSVRIFLSFTQLLMHTTFDIVVHEKGFASFDTAGHEWALCHYKNALGITIVP